MPHAQCIPAIWDNTVPLNTGERVAPGRPMLDLPTPEGWKAALTCNIDL